MRSAAGLLTALGGALLRQQFEPVHERPPCRHARQPDSGWLVEEGRAGAPGRPAGMLWCAPSLPLCNTAEAGWLRRRLLGADPCRPCKPHATCPHASAGGGEGADSAVHGAQQRRHRVLLHPGGAEELRAHSRHRHAGAVSVGGGACPNGGWGWGWRWPPVRAGEIARWGLGVCVLLLPQPTGCHLHPPSPPLLRRTSCGWTTLPA